MVVLINWYNIRTNRLFRDPGAWYHAGIVSWDTNNASAGDRMRIYINGVEETSFATETDVAQDTNSHHGFCCHLHGITY